jgi:hypothetical protein
MKRHDIAKIKALHKTNDGRNLSFEGNGSIKVDVNELLASPKVQEQIAAVARIAANCV